MDRWVVKGASGGSRIGDLSGDSSVRGAWIRGVLGFSGECRPKEAVGSGSRTGWERGASWDQGEDLGDHGGIFDGGDELQGAAALRALLDVDLEYPLEQPGPAQASPRHGRGRLGVVG